MLIENFELAETFWQRGRGLLGRKSLSSTQAMWIQRTNNIHTFFMKFSIDCIFVNRKLEIVKIVSSIPPFRLVGPYWKAQSVIETSAGFAKEKNLQVGDQLYVVS
ncbi:MAG: hypothetical protein A2622_03580 [Bdellovibrionales bacterium RIFCSPHIGHO2_01_FULL_40_29]|nr:MAG: hypothetical protein A2622_03580 [Bdellovibrionales bacterium RIFCSPHIGHO2_01_FULL_40_29]OFZ35434.1 MAG: hypothetical protein A3D17_08450 [Bdellovibrionales bacterium RIFCSPHIGHO2_02_FULL_40_15]